GLKNITRESINAVVNDFRALAGEKTNVGLDSLQYVRNVLTKALGNEKASVLLDRILQSNDTSGIEGLKWMDSATVADLIKNEHPQIIATILVHLERDQASEILGFLTERLRADVLLRIATMDGIRPTALKELNDVLGQLLAGGQNIKKSAMGGTRTVAEILNFTPGGTEGPVMDTIREHNAELAQKILDEMFVFENLLEVDDRGIQLILREVQSESLIVALKGASEELRTKILKNMSSRAADTLKEDLEAKGPVRVSEVEAQQKEILQIVRKLADDGQISLGGGGEDAFV
ncbi:MAG: flagellar motor switch protein FliG, partial [Burkholderiales bacterium]